MTVVMSIVIFYRLTIEMSNIKTKYGVERSALLIHLSTACIFAGVVPVSSVRAAAHFRVPPVPAPLTVKW